MTALDVITDALRASGNNIKEHSGYLTAQCPAHDDEHESLSLKAIEGRALVHCHAGCQIEDVIAALGLELCDLFDNRRGTTYSYSDGRNVHRTFDKQFKQSGNTSGNTLFRAERVGGAETIYVVEGEQDVLALESSGAAAVCNAGGAGKAHRFDWSLLKRKHVIIIADKDDPGRRHANEVTELLSGIAKSIRIVEAAVGKDAADHIAAGKGLDEFVEHVSPLLADLVTAADLDEIEFRELVQHVPQLVTEGFGILAGAPKAGKSWFAVAIALACAQGGKALSSIKVNPRHVLLLALEDGHRRLQTRMRILNGDEPLPKNLHILTKVELGTLTATIAEWLRLHISDENPPLVILDTLGKARPQRRAGDDPYIADYQLGTKLKNTVDWVPGAGLLAVHHTRKMGAADWLDTVSGTQGVTGSADYVLVLTRKRKSNFGMLAVTGRDVNENEYGLLVENGLWRLDGYDLDMAAERVDERREQEKLGDRALEVLAFVNGRTETRAGDLSELGIEKNQAWVYLKRLADSDRIRKIKRGVYGPVCYGGSVRDDDGTNENNITNIRPMIERPRCKHCRDPLLHPESLERGYCAKADCLLAFHKTTGCES